MSGFREQFAELFAPLSVLLSVSICFKKGMGGGFPPPYFELWHKEQKHDIER